MPRTTLLAVLALPLTTAGAQGQNGSPHPVPPPVVHAIRSSGPIAIDGRLHEPAWTRAAPATDFLQFQPTDGAPATQRTEVRFVFDNRALYIGARMYDDLGARGVRSQLVRRDGSAQSDQLSVSFDPFHDHLGRATLTINPSGARLDAYGPGGSFPDPSWDPVWEVKTRVDSLGWTAELRIPFSQLRFPRDSVQTWGVHVSRTTHRLNEISMWPVWRQTDVGGPSRFGHLEGLRISGSPQRAEMLPYVVGRSTNAPASDPANPFIRPHAADGRLGADLRLLPSPNLTLAATLNPDFGQVEADPAVVNLSAFETFFAERRPFFIEGAGLFRFGGPGCFACTSLSPLSLFYSRRIGRPPQGAGSAYAAGPYARVPENTTILGAAKLTGRMANGWSVGLLDAVTGRERAPVQRADGSQTSVEVEPLSNYFVARVAKDLRGGSTVIRAMGTSVARDLRDSALSTQLTRNAQAVGVEAESWWAHRTYVLTAAAAVSQVAGDPAAVLRTQRSSAHYFQRPDRGAGWGGWFGDRYDSTRTALRGFSGYARVAREGGNWNWEATMNLRSPGFETNDLAFMPRADFLWINANLGHRDTRVTRYTRRLSVLGGVQQQVNFDGDVTDRSVRAFAFVIFKNYWQASLNLRHQPSLADDRLTRGGPVVRVPGTSYAGLYVATDARNSLVIGSFPSLQCEREGPCAWALNLNLTYRPAPSVSMTLLPSLRRFATSRQFVTSVADSTAAAFYGRRYVFANLEQYTLSAETRLNVTFSPGLSLEFWAQPLIASARYRDFKEYTRPGGLETLAYGRAESITAPDFTFRSLRGNAVLRWEYRPGSTIFLVWTQSRSDTGPFGELDLGRDLRALVAAKATNILLVKVNYWLGI